MMKSNNIFDFFRVLNSYDFCLLISRYLSNKLCLANRFIIPYNFFYSMARFVRKEDKGPMEVKVGNESRWICMCGLSSNQPFCDGSHKKTADEEAGKVYRYNSDGTRTEVQ